MSDIFTSIEGCFHLKHTPRDKIMLSFEKLKQAIEKIIYNLENIKNPSWENLILPFNEAETLIDRFESRFVSIYVFSITNEEYQNIYGQLAPSIEDLRSQLYSSSTLINSIQGILINRKKENLSQIQVNYLETIIIRSEKYNTLLDKQTIDLSLKLNKEITDLSQIFNSNIQKSTESVGLIVEKKQDLGSLPNEWKEITSKHYSKKFNKKSTPQNGPWYISLTNGAEEPFLRFSPNRSLKEKIFCQSKMLASNGEFDNTDVILGLLKKRKELAILSNENNYLDKSLLHATANKENIDLLCSSLTQPLKKLKEKDYERYIKLARKDGLDSLEEWDFPYYRRKYEELIEYNEREVMSYFPFPSVKKNMLSLFEKFFSIQFIEATNEVKAWHEDVEFYWVFDKNSNSRLAGLYLDPYQRAGEKIVGTQNIGAFCCPIREASWRNEQYIEPVALLSFGIQTPTDKIPGLCTLENLSDIFHEFGHFFSIVFQEKDKNMLIPNISLHGDTVEFESLVLESLAREKYFIKLLSQHHETGKKLPENILNKISEILHTNERNRTHGLLFITHLSTILYSSFSPEREDLKEVQDQIMQANYPPPYFKEDKFLWGCTPLFTLDGYLANTYMYLWAMAYSYAYLANAIDEGWSEETVIKTGLMLKSTLYKYANVGEPIKALELATGKASPDFKKFAQNLMEKFSE